MIATLRIAVCGITVIILSMNMPASAFAQDTMKPFVMPAIGQASGYSTVAYSPDGKQLASSGGDGTVAVWDIRTSRVIRRFDAFESGQANNVSISPDGKRVAANSGNAVRIWDIASGALIKEFPKLATNHMAMAPDWGLIAADGIATGSVGVSYPINIVDPSSGRFVRALLGANGSPNKIAFSRDNRNIVGAFDVLVIVWDAASGRRLRTFRGHKGGVDKLALSANGQTIVSAGNYNDKTVKVWSLNSDTPLRSLSYTEAVGAIGLSDDGNLMVVDDYDGVVTIMETATGRVRAKAENLSGAYDIKFSPDDKKIAVATYDKIAFLDIATGAVVSTLESGVDTAQSVAFTPDGATLISTGNVLRMWATRDGKLSYASSEDTNLAATVSMSADGKSLATGDYKGVAFWDTASARLTGRIGGEGDGFGRVNLSRDGRLAVTARDKAIKVWDRSNGRLFRTINVPTTYHVKIALSPDNKTLVVSGLDAGFIYDISTGRMIRRLPLPKGESIYSMDLSQDGKRLLTGGFVTNIQADKIQWGMLRQWDVASGRSIRAIDDYRRVIETVAMSPDGRTVIGIGSENAIKVWDANSGRLVRQLSGNATTIKSLQFSPDGRLIAGGSESEINIWDAADGAPLVSFVASKSGEWAAITPEGFFSSSANGGNLLYIVNGLDTFVVDRFFQSLYRPDLVKEKLAGDPRGLVREAAAQLDLSKVVASGGSPLVSIISPRDGAAASGQQIDAEAEITPQSNGGIGRVEWRVNGLTIGVETPPLSPAGAPLRLSRRLALDAGSNFIEVVAYNAAGLLASEPARVSVTTAPQASVVGNARLFVLAAGVNDYADPRFKLALSVADANALAQALAHTGKGQYASVEVKILVDADVTADKLDAAFTDIAANMSPTDVFVLYLAGHGKTVDGRYYYVPQTFKVDGGLTNAGINAAVVAQGIAQDKWQNWFAAVPARRSVILFDTCESGTLTSDENITKLLEQGAASDRLAQATGRSIITASSGNTEAFEGYRGHGLFTYNLLDALDRGDGDKNGTIEVSELAAYVYAQVSAISQKVFKQRQEPQMKITTNYPLTRQGRVLPVADDLIVSSGPVVQLRQEAQLQIKPASGATVVRSLAAKTTVTVLKSEGGWSLIASEGKPLGYVATRDVAPAN